MPLKIISASTHPFSQKSHKMAFANKVSFNDRVRYDRMAIAVLFMLTILASILLS